MKIFEAAKAFRGDEDGAVTVDWVVLTAAIVGLGIIVINTVGDGLVSASDAVVEDLGNVTQYTPPL